MARDTITYEHPADGRVYIVQNHGFSSFIERFFLEEDNNIVSALILLISQAWI